MHLLKFFKYDHLPEHLQKWSKPFHDLAHTIAQELGPDEPAEATVAVRKLLEAKDAAVRAALGKKT